MDIFEKKIGEVCVISLSDRLDAYGANDVEKKLDSLIDTGQIQLVVNLENLEYISSSGLRVFLAALKKVRKQQGNMILAGMQPFIQEIFDIAGFTQLFTIFTSEESALISFSEK
jgi:anti-sigma B factor antagonist